MECMGLGEMGGWDAASRFQTTLIHSRRLGITLRDPHKQTTLRVRIFLPSDRGLKATNSPKTLSIRLSCLKITAKLKNPSIVSTLGRLNNKTQGVPYSLQCVICDVVLSNSITAYLPLVNVLQCQ